MHPIERELVKACNYKVQRKFADRQDYLKSIFNAAQKLSDPEFDSLSDEAAAWLNSCVTVFNSKRNAEIPDFDEEVEIDDDADPEMVNGKAVEENGPEDQSMGDESSSEDETPDESEDEAPESESQPDEDEIKPRKSTKKLEGKKAAPRPNARKPKPVKKEKQIPKDDPPLEFDDDAVVDKWGCLVGSKNAMALAMFEKGATSREVKQVMGGTFYNLLSKMAQRGHKIEKEGTLFKLTHKDELQVSSRKSKK